MRNNNGYGLTNFKITDLPENILKTTLDNMPSLETVQMGGNLGDPCAGKLIDKYLDMIIPMNIHIQIHTNGSLRSTQWWKNLAQKLPHSHEVWFAIDGLENTHSIYRQGTDWKKIIKNAQAFINAGGKAVWQFIPFSHNEHQIKECMVLCTKLGFHRFEFVKNARYPKQNFHYKTGKPIEIAPWSKHNDSWNRKGGILDKNTTIVENSKVKEKNCMHLAMKSVYLSALGKLSPCCYLPFHDLTNIDISKTLREKNFLPTCLSKCGSTN
jgi:hypothetical protein